MKRSTRTHDLKTVKPYFGLMQEGVKDFDIRFDDKDFLVDNILNFQEYKYGEPTGECVQKRIKYILRRFKGLQTGYVVLGLEGIDGEEIKVQSEIISDYMETIRPFIQSRKKKRERSR